MHALCFQGRSETRAEMLMSIMAIYSFRSEISRSKELPDTQLTFRARLSTRKELWNP